MRLLNMPRALGLAGVAAFTALVGVAFAIWWAAGLEQDAATTAIDVPQTTPTVAKPPAGADAKTVQQPADGSADSGPETALADVRHHCAGLLAGIAPDGIFEIYKGAWLASQCAPHYNILRWMADRPQRFDGLMTRAAAFGNEFALADRLLSRRQAELLLERNPLQAFLHLAKLDGQQIEEEWRRADAEAIRQAKLPYFETRRALLALAGIECEDPCEEATLRALETKHAKRHDRWTHGCLMRLEALRRGTAIA